MNKSIKRRIKRLYCEHFNLKKVLITKTYRRKSDKRKVIHIRGLNFTTCKLYAKVKLEIKLGRILSREETVDHIDENPLNDKFCNLQLLSREANARKSAILNSTHKRFSDYTKSRKHKLRSRNQLRHFNPAGKLTTKQVLNIRKETSKCLCDNRVDLVKSLAVKYKCSP